MCTAPFSINVKPFKTMLKHIYYIRLRYIVFQTLLSCKTHLRAIKYLSYLSNKCVFYIDFIILHNKEFN